MLKNIQNIILWILYIFNDTIFIHFLIYYFEMLYTYFYENPSIWWVNLYQLLRNNKNEITMNKKKQHQANDDLAINNRKSCL